MSEPPDKPARPRPPGNFRQQDVARAIKALKGTGLKVVRLEMDMKAAKLTMWVKGDDDETEIEVKNPFDEAPLPEPVRQKRKRSHES